MTGTVFITDLRRDYDGRPVTFAIYCDDMQVYSLEMKDNLPQQFEIDVSDCESMRIQIDNIPTEFSGYEMTDNLIGLSAELEEK